MSIPFLYVTTFNKKLYEVSGRNLVKSYLKNLIKEPLLLVYEENAVTEYKDRNNLLYHNLDNNELLKNWLEKFKHVIPKAYGGTAPDCKCSITKKIDKWNGHNLGCSHSEWNRRASKWFRKIVALEYAMTLKAERIVFLDCDTYFLRYVDHRLWNTLFNVNGLIYHLGQYRKKMGTCIESGIIGFSEKHGGFNFLRKVIQYYLSGEFIKHPRWDDCYAFSYILNQTSEKELRRHDLVVIDKRTSHVVNLGKLRNYLIHNKGHHWRIHKIV